MAHILLGVAGTEDIASGLFLTTQDLQSIYTIRECDLIPAMPDSLPCAPFRTFLILSKLALALSTNEDPNAKMVASRIAEVRIPIAHRTSSWLKRVCFNTPIWAYKAMVVVSADVDGDIISKGPEASIRHFANCGVFYNIVSDRMNQEEGLPINKLTIESCRESFRTILQKMNDWTFDRLWIELQFMFDGILAFGESAGISALMCFDVFVDLLFERLLEPEMHLRFLSRLVEGLRWEVLSRFLQHISWLLEGVLSPPPSFRADSPNSSTVNKWCKALRGDEKYMRIFIDVAVLGIHTAEQLRLTTEEGR